ncbi:MAG TPA: serine/threonine-protein kinase [Candidatus Obscuribacterales bacterium]
MAVCPVCGTAPHNGPCPRAAAPQHAANIVLQGRYELIGLLGQGGMGTVYMARDLRLHNRPCVVKKLRDDFYREEDKQKAVAFFKREAGVLSQLQHHNIVHILDYFEENYDYFLVMDYVEGRDLYNILKERGEPFSEDQVLDWAEQICDVLEYLHEHEPPVIYRDLKPSNVMIDVKGRVKLVDFGIARPYEDNTDHTHVVSAGYSPPEQYWGAADVRSDIYALGATMFFLLTGSEPVALHPCHPLSVNPAVSEHTNMVVYKATAQDPDERYQSAKEMRAALRSRSEDKPVPARSRARDLLVLLGIVLVAGAAFLALIKLDESLRAKSEQLKATEAIISRHNKEKTELTKKLDAYTRAVQAQEQAVLEWREQARSKPHAPPPVARSAVAAQVTSEALLTDPEGLASLQDDSQSSGLSPPAWGDD